jgi:diguanylate cyclase (GGDEF)-like protein/PAS domain S-box-containing protein
LPEERTPTPVAVTYRRFLEDRMLDSLGVAACVADAANPDLPLTYVNPAFEALTGWERADAVGRSARFLQGPDTDPRAVAEIRDALVRGEDCRVTLLNYRRNGESFWNQLTLTPIRSRSRVVAWVATLVEATSAATRLHEVEAELRAERDEARRQALHDGLTGLPNRLGLDNQLRAAVARARRRERAVALLFLDLDNFKLVNDSLGHAAGDRLLRRVAARLAGVEAPAGMLARHGGDEFLVLLEDLDPHDAERVARAAADDIAVRLAKPFSIAGAEFHVEASVGISLFPGDADGANTLLQHADAAMYQSKGRGRAASTLYARMTGDPLERLSLSSRLRRAIAGDELELYYQPIVWTASGRLHSMEALLRWNDPDRGLVHPDRFIPAAEEMSLLEPIGDWVVGALARQMREWRWA